jgi:hypothetical protein
MRKTTILCKLNKTLHPNEAKRMNLCPGVSIERVKAKRRLMRLSRLVALPPMDLEGGRERGIPRWRKSSEDVLEMQNLTTVTLLL